MIPEPKLCAVSRQRPEVRALESLGFAADPSAPEVRFVHVSGAGSGSMNQGELC